MRTVRRLIRWCDYYLPVLVSIGTAILVLWALFSYPPEPWSWQR